MASELDSFDLKILSHLQEDGRVSVTELAERVGLSASPCARRVKRLEDEGFIDKYVALLNPKKMDAELLVFVSVRLQSQTSDAFNRFDAEVANIPEIVGCHLLAGTFDYLLQVRMRDIEYFHKFMRERLTAVEGVIETQSSIVLEQLKSTTLLPINHRPNG